MFMSKNSCQTMLVLAAGGLALMLAAFGSPTDVSPGAPPDLPRDDRRCGQRAVGVWFGKTFFGDPSDPATPAVQYALTLHADGTALITASDQTGHHPLLPGEGTSGHGVWECRDQRLSIRTFQFADGPNPPATFGLLRISGECQLVDTNHMTGMGGFDVLTCPNGPLGCSSPNDSPFPAANAFVFTLERLR